MVNKKVPSDSQWHWGKELIACIEDLQATLQQHQPPVVDREIIPPFCGSPEGILLWFICERTNEIALLKASEDFLKTIVRDRMKAREFPKSAIASLQVFFTSLEEIESGGGRFYSFR